MRGPAGCLLLRRPARSRNSVEVLNGGSTELAHLYVVACIDYARAKKLSFGTLFVDVASARSLAFPAPPACMDAFVARLWEL
eukprot:4551402-Pyramimonas_sp.AAC.1